MDLSPVSRARRRPRGSRKEVFIWYLMRITGVALFVIALAHFSINHFVFDPAHQTAEWIIEQRWNQVFWRAFAWLLLMTALFHAFLVARTVVLDYLHRPRLRTGVLWVLYVLAVLLFVLGTDVIISIPARG
jgi:succinate dehydrogenase / fumarate reductase, membrane anchor subunit